MTYQASSSTPLVKPSSRFQQPTEGRPTGRTLGACIRASAGVDRAAGIGPRARRCRRPPCMVGWEHARVLAVSHWIDETGWSIRQFVHTARRYRTVEIRAGRHASPPLTHRHRNCATHSRKLADLTCALNDLSQVTTPPRQSGIAASHLTRNSSSAKVAQLLPRSRSAWWARSSARRPARSAVVARRSASVIL